MKKLIALLLTLALVLAFAACVPAEDDTTTTEATTTEEIETVLEPMSYAEYMAAEVGAEVCVETYVQGNQSWWEDKITLYCQTPEGAHFIYELACSEDDAAKLVPGTKICVTGEKTVWDGEVEIMNATFEFVEGGDTYIAEAMDATALLGTEELESHMNKLVSFSGLTLKAIEYKNGEPGDDIYLTMEYEGNEYSFCVERYLTGPDSDVYTTVGALELGTVVDVEGYLYWYYGANPHITAISASVSE